MSPPPPARAQLGWVEAQTSACPPKPSVFTEGIFRQWPLLQVTAGRAFLFKALFASTNMYVFDKALKIVLDPGGSRGNGVY